jgi:hypothetical protein
MHVQLNVAIALAYVLHCSCVLPFRRSRAGKQSASVSADPRARTWAQTEKNLMEQQNNVTPVSYFDVYVKCWSILCTL